MSSLPEKSSSHRRLAVLLGCVTFFSFIYFYEGGGWNQNSRFDLLRAIVERHTLQIDAYHENTQDKAHFNGHYYSDKAPGLVFLAVPFAYGARAAMRVVGMDPEWARGEFVLSYVVTACSVALPTALAAVCLFYLALRFGCGAIAASFAALVMCVGTPIWAYASLFWAHALVGACLVFAFACAMKIGDDSRRDFLWAVGTGLAAGWATVTEYPAAPASAILALFALTRAWPRGNASRWKVIAGVGYRGGDLHRRVAGIFARCIWRVSSELFVLRSEFVFVYAVAGIYGADVSASGPGAEVVVWMRAGIVFCFSGDAGCRGWIVVVKKNESGCGVGGGRNRSLLLFVQRIVLLVEGWADVWAAIRRGLHSSYVLGLAVAWKRSGVCGGA